MSMNKHTSRPVVSKMHCILSITVEFSPTTYSICFGHNSQTINYNYLPMLINEKF